MTVHEGDVERMVEHHVRLGVNGLFLAGTNGEGPWLPRRERRKLVRAVAACAKGRLVIAQQVTDNSAARIAENMEQAAEDGAEIAVIAPPDFFMNTTADNLERHYVRAVEASPLPVGIYDRGSNGAVQVPPEVLARVYQHEKVILVKDSSAAKPNADMALAAREARPSLHLLDGDEFHCVDYLRLGYDGLLLGGGVFNGYIAGQIIRAVQAGDIPLAGRLQERMNRIMWDVYGGKSISCWLSGEKKLLLDMGILSTWRNFPDFPLTDSCREAIARVLRDDADVLFP